jgi:single-stranded DNA-specific DHH superfamily exonuclease
MAIIYNEQELPAEYDILMDKWKLKCVTNDIEAKKPPFCVFNNTSKLLEKLHYHFTRNSRICFHTDVDVDGIGTTYIIKKAAENLGSTNHLLLINKDKVHGIQQKHANYFNTNNIIDLMIITDSSSNEIDIIKQFNCDVICIDHHELLHNDLYGKCNDGVHEYIITNNTIANSNQEEDNLWLRSRNISAFNNLEDYKGDDDMSCGVVVYELLRLYCECFANPKLLENLRLNQWAGVTLITDVINTLNERNQWYLNSTVFSKDTETSLSIMMHNINKFKATLDKTYIGYTFAPLINKAIRAGASNEALSTLINKPSEISQLNKYAELQKEAIDKVANIVTINETTGQQILNPRKFTQPSILLDIGQFGVSPNYSGVIASRLGGDNHKDAAVYIVDNGLCRGSFRGKYKEVNYRKYFADYNDDIYAQGHPGAFGFRLKYEELEHLMNNIDNIEPIGEQKPWLTAGNMNKEEYGIYHINDIDEFKRQGYLWRIAIGNSKVTSSDEINIRVKARDVVLKSTKGKLFIYDVLGMECKAFKPLTGEYFDIYAEYTNEIELFIR